MAKEHQFELVVWLISCVVSSVGGSVVSSVIRSVVYAVSVSTRTPLPGDDNIGIWSIPILSTIPLPLEQSDTFKDPPSCS